MASPFAMQGAEQHSGPSQTAVLFGAWQHTLWVAPSPLTGPLRQVSLQQVMPLFGSLHTALVVFGLQHAL